MDQDDDVRIDPAWAESFSLDLGPEQTLRAAVDSASAETLLQDDAPTAAAAMSMAPSGDTARAETLVLGERGSTGLSSSVPTRRLLASRDTGSDADYLLGGELGVGGMGVVCAAEQASLGRTVALKRQRPDRRGDPSLSERFVAEAMVTGLLEHPNIVPVYELGEDATGGPFYTMKLVQGQSWDQVIDGKSLDENLEIWQGVADGIAFAHSKGLVHCDLKPANVMLGAHGEVLVVDWGLAMRREAEARFASPIAPGGTVGGTPAYMPPELAKLDRMAIGPCTDIYLLGALLFRMLSGHAPHHGDSLQGCLRNAVENVMRDVTVEDGRREYLAIAQHAMATEVEGRFASVQEMQEALRVAGRQGDSRQLLRRAEELARPGADHLQFDRALAACSEARELWADNPAIDDCESVLRCRYAEAAMAQQDNALAVKLLRQGRDEERQLRRRAEEELQRQQRRRRQLRLALLLTMGLGLLVAGALLRGIIFTEIERARAEEVRDRAEAAWRETRRQAADAALARAAVAQRRHDDAAARSALERVAPEDRSWEWRILDHATDGGHRVLGLPGCRPRGLAWSADGSQLYLVDLDGLVQVIDAETLSSRRRFETGFGGVAACWLSPAGDRLLLRSRTGVQILDLGAGSMVHSAEQENRVARWFGQGHYLLLDKAKNLILRSLDGDDDQLWTFDEQPSCVAVDGARILVGVAGTVLALDPADPEFREPIFADAGSEVIAIARDDDGLVFFSLRDEDDQAAGRFGMYVRIRREGEDTPAESALRGERPQLPRFGTDGFAFSIPRDKAVYIKDEGADSTIRQLLFPAAISAMAVHPDGRLLACGRADALHLVQAPAKRPLAQDAFPSHQADLAYAGDDLYSIDILGAVYRRDPRDGSIREQLRPSRRLWAARIGSATIDPLPGGQLLICTGSELGIVDGGGYRDLLPRSNRLAVSVSPDGALAASSSGSSELVLWELPAGREILRFAPDVRHPLGSCLTWSPDGKTIAVTTSDDYIFAVDPIGQEIRWWRRASESVSAMASSRRGLVVACADRMWVMDWHDGETVAEMHGHQADISALAVDDEAGRLISGDLEGWLLFWDLERWEQRLGIRVAPLQIFCIAADRDRLAHAAHDWMLRCWDLSGEGVGNAP